MDRRAMRGVIAAVAALGLGGAAAGQELYMMYGGDEPYLLRVDGPTGVVIDSLPILGATYLLRGLALRWDGMLFTTDRAGADSYRLFRIHPKTGQGEVIGGDLPEAMVALAADPTTGRLYGVNGYSGLYQIDHKTGQAVLIGTLEAPELNWPVLAMAIGPDGAGYVTNMYDIALFRVDLATAETTFVCQLGSQNWYEDMAFDDDGMLWAVLAWDGGLRRADIDPCKVTVLHDGWYVSGLEVVPADTGCYADCNADETLDFFQNAFNAGDPRAECTGDDAFNFFDFLCFLNAFDGGC